MTRPRHPNKEIEAAVQYAESLGWRFRKGHGHLWAKLLCPFVGSEGCQVRVDSTPRNSENQAKRIRREVLPCPHGDGTDADRA